MKRIITLISISITLLIPSLTSAQDNFLSEDYKTFGRKEPMSVGSLFGSLGTSTILVNPANVAFVTDNRINFGGGVSDIGYGKFTSWMAPNLTISSAYQTIEKSDTITQDHEKQLLHFGFGISTKDLGFRSDDRAMAIGIAIKRQADRLVDGNDQTIDGGNAVSIDIGFLLKLRRLALEMTIINSNSPKLSNSNISYSRSFIFGGRFTTSAGLTIALQGVGGNAYAGTDLGLNFGAEQSFFEHRLTSRVQLTSFFKGAKAIMQNITGGIGYRLDPNYRLITFLKDLEFSYALSFLALPNNVGTHLIVVTKYF